jgi:hypothetical protein
MQFIFVRLLPSDSEAAGKYVLNKSKGLSKESLGLTFGSGFYMRLLKLIPSKYHPYAIFAIAEMLARDPKFIKKIMAGGEQAEAEMQALVDSIKEKFEAKENPIDVAAAFEPEPEQRPGFDPAMDGADEYGEDGLGGQDEEWWKNL